MARCSRNLSYHMGCNWRKSCRYFNKETRRSKEATLVWWMDILTLFAQSNRVIEFQQSDYIRVIELQQSKMWSNSRGPNKYYHVDDGKERILPFLNDLILEIGGRTPPFALYRNSTRARPRRRLPWHTFGVEQEDARPKIQEGSQTMPWPWTSGQNNFPWTEVPWRWDL